MEGISRNHKKVKIICETRMHVRLEKEKRRYWDKQEVLDIGIKNHSCGSKVFKVKLKAKINVLKISLGVKILKLREIIRNLIKKPRRR